MSQFPLTPKYGLPGIPIDHIAKIFDYDIVNKMRYKQDKIVNDWVLDTVKKYKLTCNDAELLHYPNYGQDQVKYDIIRNSDGRCISSITVTSSITTDDKYITFSGSVVKEDMEVDG